MQTSYFSPSSEVRLYVGMGKLQSDAPVSNISRLMLSIQEHLVPHPHNQLAIVYQGCQADQILTNSLLVTQFAHL